MTERTVENPGPEKVAVVAGASGLVGGNLLQTLLESGYYKRIYSIGRKELALKNPALHQLIVDFENLPENLQADDYFCCLGTTINKAGSKEAFRKIDLEYPLALARIAKKFNGRYFIVTALGADAGSTIFYNQVKGEVENELRNLNLPALHIFRPSLLVGKRAEKRFGESLAQTMSAILSFLFIGSLRKYKPIPASLVAQAMLKEAYTEKTGTHVHESGEMLEGI